MATTTNYSWETPDDTDLVKDGAAAIRTLGSSIDTTTKNLNPSTTLGDIEYRSSTANVNTRLGIGSTGQVLTVSGGVPAWATPAGGGKVLQVVQATYSTEVTTTSTSYVDTGVSASITPSSSSSKVLVLGSQNIRFYRSNNTAGGGLSILRGSTTVLECNPIRVYQEQSGTSTELAGQYPLVYLDSPSTTSSTTYKLQMKTEASVITAVAQGSSYGTSTSTIILMEIGA